MTPTSRNPVHYDRIGGLGLTVWATKKKTYKKLPQVHDNISHYTYMLKSERPYRVVLRGLHSSEDTTEIKEILKENGHEVRQIVNVRHRTSKEPLPLFYVDLEPKSNNRDIFNLKYLNSMKITFEPPYKKKEIIQCKRCQRLGHYKNQCHRPFRCVKVGEDHPTSTCKKTKDSVDFITCANCQQKHPASYRGCAKYKQYKEHILKVQPKATRTNLIKRQTRKPDVDISQTNNNTLNKNTPNYATKTNKTTNSNEPVQMQQLEDILDKMFNRMQTMMINMVDNMMDRFTSKSFLSVKGYTTYNTNHPSGNAHGGTAVLIKCNIKHHSLEPFATDKIQATLIKAKTTRGRQLYQAVKELNLECLSTDYTIRKRIGKNTEILLQKKHNLRSQRSKKLNKQLKINKLIHSAANRSTPQGKAGRAKEHVYPTFIRDSVTERRRLRREWQNNHYARDKTAFNKESQQLKALTKEWTNEVLQDHFAKLTPTSDTNYSLYKATKNMKRPKQQATPIKTQMGTWARSDGEKATTFTDHLQKVLEPPPSDDHSVDNEINEYLSSPNQLCLPLKHVTLNDLSREIRKLKEGKCLGYDLVDATLLKQLPKKGLLLILAIFNACLRLSFYLSQWKIAQVVMIQKPADLPAHASTTTATYADDTAILSTHENQDSASDSLQQHLNLIENGLDSGELRPTLINRFKYAPRPTAHVAQTYMDKRKQLDCKLRGMYWLIGRKSQLSDASKMTIYKTILKPVWTYGIQIWGTASHSNIEILERFQSKTMGAMFNIPPYISK
ncbi:Nucleic-acid-binding protein from transposon X-element [Eumeta japonica]|uniref:Nucleic-acid-binding protein from transposon X-element n=1 Tax=Eumeta variegata TaxID=151549 RepID=A0A4C1XBC0_EUMVA|nr:Nucleic-acid-binding protein from transposon X-element [Eumeta japonica]